MGCRGQTPILLLLQMEMELCKSLPIAPMERCVVGVGVGVV